MLLGSEGCGADGAFVHLLPVVRHLVQLQHVVVTEGLAADIATVGFLTSVRSHVHLELLGAGEPFIASPADVRLLPGVGAHVDDQLAALDEGLVADAAGMRSLPCVDPHVAVQLARVLQQGATSEPVGRSIHHVNIISFDIILDNKKIGKNLQLNLCTASKNKILWNKENTSKDRLQTEHWCRRMPGAAGLGG